jgi:hypothetical protein
MSRAGRYTMRIEMGTTACIPYSKSFVIRSRRDTRAVWGECNGTDDVGMSLELVEMATTDCVPQSKSIIAVSGNNSRAVWGECYCFNRATIWPERVKTGATDCIPQFTSIARSRRDTCAVRRECYRKNSM